MSTSVGYNIVYEYMNGRFSIYEYISGLFACLTPESSYLGRRILLFSSRIGVIDYCLCVHFFLIQYLD